MQVGASSPSNPPSFSRTALVTVAAFLVVTVGICAIALRSPALHDGATAPTVDLAYNGAAAPTAELATIGDCPAISVVDPFKETLQCIADCSTLSCRQIDTPCCPVDGDCAPPSCTTRNGCFTTPRTCEAALDCGSCDSSKICHPGSQDYPTGCPSQTSGGSSSSSDSDDVPDECQGVCFQSSCQYHNCVSDCSEGLSDSCQQCINTNNCQGCRNCMLGKSSARPGALVSPWQLLVTLIALLAHMCVGM